MDRVTLKKTALEQIKGKIGLLFLIGLIQVGFSIVLSFIPVVGNIVYSFVFAPAFFLSEAIIYLKLVNGEAFSVSDVFAGFYDLWSAIKVSFFITLFTFLWSLLFFIPGIIKGISYSMSMYILAENKGMGALEAISRSKKMMHGHKMDFFVLRLSFLGWIILGIFTLGILYIWLVPYMNAAYLNFYNSIKPHNETQSVNDDFIRE
ncbi:MAG: DUF975 family protein [Clostridia bacterium]